MPDSWSVVERGEPSDGGGATSADVSWWVVAEAPPGLADALVEFVPSWLARAWTFATVRYPS